MTAKEYLMQARRMKIRYKRALEELEYIRSMADGVKAIRYDKDRVQSSAQNDQMANYMIRLERAEDRAGRLSERCFETFTKICTEINTITPGNYSDVLYMKYIDGMTLWDIAEELNFSYSHVKRIHGRALQEFAIQYADRLKDEP